MLEIDGARYSGSGTIVRQAVALAALTGTPIRISSVRANRPNPGLRPQHVRVVEAIRELAGGKTGGVQVGAKEIVFWPGALDVQPSYRWDIGSAGSTLLLALAILPVLAFAPRETQVEIQGGLLQDFAPSFFHTGHVVLPLLARMGLEATVEMARPGYVPRGGGILRMRVKPARVPLQPLVLAEPGAVKNIWGVALASHLEEQQVAERMARAAQDALGKVRAKIDIRNDATSVQPGAALALFADLEGGARLGADLAGKPGRRSEAIGRDVARMLIEDVNSGATLDRHAADQLIPFAALADGESRYLCPGKTDHIESNAWLAREFLGADVHVDARLATIRGAGFHGRPSSA